jgi:peptidoglycan/LPS O-acetylase OafA/YrhL
MTSTTTAAAGVRRHIAGLDGIRASAAGLVLVYHYWATTGKAELPAPLHLVVSNGGIGVNIFFVISGFILFLPWARAGWTGGRVDRRRYFRNRFFRIIPAFWFNTLVVVLAAYPVLLLSVEGLGKIAVYGTLLAGFAPPGVASGLMLNGVAWTLCIEVTFYVALPLVARFFVRDRWWVALPAVLVLTTCFKLVAIAHYGQAGLAIAALQNLAGTFNEFAVGMAVAAIWAKLEHRQVELRRGVGLACTVVGIVGVWATMYWGQQIIGREAYTFGTGPLGWIPLLTMFPVVAGFSGLALFGICYQANLVTRFLSLRPIAWLGVVSYGIYLWHLPIGQWLAQAMSPEQSPLYKMAILLVVGTALTLIWSVVSYRFVEQPFLRRKSTPVAPSSDEADSTVVLPRPRPAVAAVGAGRSEGQRALV